MKSRLVVWTLVGTTVIVGVVVIAGAPKTTPVPKVTLDPVRSEAAKAETQIDRLSLRIVDARKAFSQRGVPADGLDEAERLLAQAREKLAQAEQSTTPKQAESLLIDGRQALRRALEIATRSWLGPRGT